MHPDDEDPVDHVAVEDEAVKPDDEYDSLDTHITDSVNLQIHILFLLFNIIQHSTSKL